MNKIVSMLLLAIFMAVSSPSAMAYWEEGKPQENQTVANIKTLAIAAPLYTEKKGYPTLEEYINILNTRGAKVSPKKYKVVPYDVIAKGILQTTGKDLYTLNRIASVRVFRNNIAQYADAYVVPTVTTSKRTVLFFDVHSAATNDLLYTYTSESRADGWTRYLSPAARNFPISVPPLSRRSLCLAAIFHSVCRL